MSTGCGKPSGSRTDSCIWRIAHRQSRNITLAQLGGCGLGTGAIRYRVGIGRLHPVFARVLAVGTPQDSRLGFFRAATLSAGESDSALAFFSAGQNFGVFKGRVGAIHIRRARRTDDRDCIRFHPLPEWIPTTVHNGIPTTTIEQTLLDLALVMYSDRAYERAVREALVLELTSYERLCDFAERTAPGVRRLRAVLAKGSHRTRSRNEDDFLTLLSEHGLARPESVNHRLHGIEVDFHWPDRGLVVEVDGGVHDNALAQADDERKQAILERNGLRVVRIGEAALRRQSGR